MLINKYLLEFAVNMVARSLPFLLPTLLLFIGCTNDPVYQEHSVLVSGTDLPPLSASEGHYQLWFSYPDDDAGKRNGVSHGDDVFISMGTFVVDADGTMRSLDGGAASLAIPEGYNPNLLIDAILTVEPPGDNDDEPAGRLLGGDFTGSASQGVATLRTKGNDAFGPGLDSIYLRGEARLTTPSTLDGSDEAQGIWFVDMLDQATLALRSQPINLENESWTYQGWLIKRGGASSEYISLGTFDDAADEDSDGAGPNAGTGTPLKAPGQDFVQGTIRTLNDGTYGVLISLQPIGLSLSHPFYPLMKLDTIPAGYRTDQLLPLGFATTAPKIEITVNR